MTSTAAQSANAARKVVLRVGTFDAGIERLRAAFPEADFVTCPRDAGLSDHLYDAEVLIGGLSLSAEILKSAPRLRWAQSLRAGVEGFLDPLLEARSVIVTNGRGINAGSIAEHALALMLAFARGLPSLLRRQAQADWRPFIDPPKLFELSGQTLCLLGFGEIGRAVAQRAKAFGMTVFAMRRDWSRGGEGLADRVFGRDALNEIASAADHLMLVLPLTPQTRGLVDGAVLSQLRPSAYIYNIGRGELVRQDDLIAALQEGRIAGAGLDVTDPEPLPVSSPLWTMPNVILTGHTAALSPHAADRMLTFLEDNLSRYRAGLPLRNRINRAEGY